MPDHVIVQAFTAVEIEHMAIISGKTTREVLADLKDAGLDALPGGGAEIFSERTRVAAWDKKTKGDVWLRIHGEAHELGIATNCTMLYGHIETAEERVDHLIRLREQQDQTGGFLAFIPLAFHPANTELDDLPATTGFDDLKTLAIARLMLDNIPHIKAFWIMLGLKIAQISTALRRRRPRRHRGRGAHHAHGRRHHPRGAVQGRPRRHDRRDRARRRRARHALPHREAPTPRRAPLRAGTPAPSERRRGGRGERDRRDRSAEK